MKKKFFIFVLLFLFAGCAKSSPSYVGPLSYIDKTGKRITEKSFDFAKPFSEGLGCFSTGQKAGFIDKKGKIVIEPKFTYCNSFHNGTAWVTTTADGSGGRFINHEGEFVPEPPKGTRSNFHEGLAISGEYGEYHTMIKYGYEDENGKLIIPRIFYPSNYDYGFDFHEGLAAVNVKGLIGFIDKTGKMVIPPQYYRLEGQGFSDGLALVWIKENYNYPAPDNLAFINKQGKVVFKPMFAQPFSEGLAAVTTKDAQGYINSQGKMVLKLNFKNIEYFGSFSDGVAHIAFKDGKDIYIDKTGKTVVEVESDIYEPWDFSEGVAIVCLDDSQMQCSSP